MSVLVLLLLLVNAGPGSAQDAGSLAKAAQNPVSDVISLPLQNNALFDVGPDDDVANVLNVQPVIPVALGDDWNLVNRTIAPLIALPDLTAGLPEVPGEIGGGSSFGLGDVNHTVFLSPAEPGPVVWGLGPSITFPTATDDRLGAEKWSAGPSAVLLAMPGDFVLGALARQLWSFGGAGDREDVSQLLVQPFVNYNLPDGWYLVSAPVVTANWKADSGNRWTVPVGGGLGRLVRLGSQPLNVSLQGYYNLERPRFAPRWTLRFQVQLLFPR